MEVRINKEVLNYKETLFFGLTLRQFICSALAVGVAVGLYFCLKDKLGQEVVSWICILSAAPFGVAGFFQYHGMPLERFLWVWFQFTFLQTKVRVWRSEHRYLAEKDTRKKGRK